MDKSKIIGELAKIKYYADRTTAEIQKEISTKQTVKTEMDPLVQSVQIIIEEINK